MSSQQEQLNPGNFHSSSAERRRGSPKKTPLVGYDRLVRYDLTKRCRGWTATENRDSNRLPMIFALETP